MAKNNEEWTILRLPAIAETDDPLGRPPGAPLWPEWEGLEALRRKRTLVGERVWSALFQQSPRPSEGYLFKIDTLRGVDHEPTVTRCVRAWDLAATAVSARNDPDWTVGVKLAQLNDGRYLIHDVVRLRGSAHDVEQRIMATAHNDGHSVVVGLPIDPGQAGKSQISRLSSMLAGYRVYSSRETGTKLSRATPVAAQMDAGNLLIRNAPWNSALIEELKTFPHGMKDDQVDALSRAFTTISELQNTGRRVFIPFNTR